MTSLTAAPSQETFARFAAVVGERNALSAPDLVAPYLLEPRDLYKGRTQLVLRPGSTEEVSAIMRIATETRTAIVPQGGNTGLVGGQSPRSDAEVVLSLSRLDRIRDIDPLGRTLVAEAGVVLQRAQEAADGAGLLFPLSLGSEGSCQIGGNLASNAGGTGVIAYGNARELCLGLEVVLASGEVIHGLRRLKKDNRGYDWKDLLIGSEGTLAIITAAVLRLFPKPAGREVAYVGVTTPQNALRLLTMAQDRAGPQLTAFELMARVGMEFTLRHTKGARDPLGAAYPWYVLVEISSSRSAEDARQTMEDLLEAALTEAAIEDAAIAQSLSDAKAFWTMREEMSWAQKPEGGSIKHDVAVPVARVPEFLAAAETAVLGTIPDARIVAFGHLGDGNIHFNVSQGVGADTAAFLSRWGEINALVHDIASSMDGTFSAEHGIGQLKREELAKRKSGPEIELMRSLKQMFDPYQLLNPGKVV